MTDEHQEEYERVRGIMADGIATDFWKELRLILTDLMDQAKGALVDVNQADLAQAQQMYKVPDMLITTVEGLAEEQSVIDKKKLKEMQNDPA